MKARMKARYTARSLERGLQILQMYSRTRSRIGAPEMARELAIPRSTVHRLVSTLEVMGFLQRSEGELSYALAPSVLTIGFEYLGSLDIVQLSNRILSRLRDEIRCATHLAVRSGTDIVYLSRHAAEAELTNNVSVGVRLPAHATVTGRVILADLSHDQLRELYGHGRLRAYGDQTPTTLSDLRRILDRDRRRGYAFGMSFYAKGVMSVAAPIRDGSGRVVAAINATSVEPARGRKELFETMRRGVCGAAAEITVLRDGSYDGQLHLARTAPLNERRANG